MSTVIVGGGVLIIAALAARKIYRDKRNGKCCSGCSGGCSGCPGNCNTRG